MLLRERRLHGRLGNLVTALPLTVAWARCRTKTAVRRRGDPVRGCLT